MKKKIAKIILLSMMISIFSHTNIIAGRLDTEIPVIPSNTISLDTDGTATFVPPAYTTIATISGVPTPVNNWKKFELQLLKRYSVIDSGTTKYMYKKQGSILSCNYDEKEVTFNFTKSGYYQVQVRGVNLEGNYGYWSWQSGYQPLHTIEEYTSWTGLPIEDEDLSPGGGKSSGSVDDGTIGPGIAQMGNIPAGYQYAVVGPNGEIMYYYGGNTSMGAYSGYGNQNGLGYYQVGNNSQIYGPAYANNMQGGNQVLYPNTGVSNYQQVTTPNVNGITSNGTYVANNSAITNPNYYNGNTGVNGGSASNNPSITPQITQGLEVGWHVDNFGRFYYQGSGTVLKSTWYLIDGQFYRFGDNGYLLANQWFKDTNTGQWYFLAGDGHMLTGWQNLNGTWYYFKPETGTGYGTMYANTQMFINDPQWGQGNYAFDTNGAMIKNAWYGGHYYGNDGNRTN